MEIAKICHFDKIRTDYKPRLCIITPSFIGGGAERIAVNLANHYTSAGYDVSLLVFKGIGPYANQVNKDVRLIDLKISRSRYVFFRLWKALKNENPTHVLSVIRGSNMVLGMLAWISKNYKLIYREASTLSAISRLPMVHRLVFKLFMKITYKKANLIVANSEGTKDDLISNNIVPRNKVIVIGNPVLPPDYESKMEQSLAHPWFLNPEIKVLLSVGRLHKIKNHSLLLKAFSEVSEKINELRLVILGSGEERNNLLELARKLNISDKIQIIPFQDNPYPYYKNADLFVLTSEWEGFGNVLVEAMACGLPIISTDCPGGPRTILGNGKRGVLVPVGCLKKLSESIESCLLARKEGNVSAKEGFYSKYTVESIAIKYYSAMISICSDENVS